MMEVDKKHILIVSLWYPSESRPSYGVFVRNQAVLLTKKYKVTVVLVRWNIMHKVEQTTKDEVTILTVSGIYLPPRKNYLLHSRSRLFLSAIKEYMKSNPIDIIHSHSYMSAFVGQYISNDTSIPHVTTIHDTTILNESLPQWKKERFIAMMPSAQKVIAVGQALEDKLRNTYKLENTVTIGNSIDTQYFTLRPRVDSPIETFIFLFVGSFDRRKGLLEMLQAFALLENNNEFHFVGYGEMEDPMVTLIDKLGISDRVFFYGNLPNHKLAPVYHKCHAYVCFSSLETFGVTVVEALSCGLPVIYTPCGGPEHTVPDYGGIEVKERTVEALVAGMESMIKNYFDFEHEKISAYVNGRFSIEMIEQNLTELYQEILD